MSRSVLVGIMYSGEPQFERSCKSVELQSGVDCTLFFVKHKSNLEAHSELYRIFESSSGYDYFLKLDADMELAGDGALAWMIAQAEAEPETDMISFSVFDHFTQNDMWAVHLFSPRCSWSTVLDPMFVDRPPVFPGKRRKVLVGQPPVVHHCKAPDQQQAFIFGLHRATKVVQRHRRFLIGESWIQWQTLRKVASTARTNPAIVDLVLRGASKVFKESGHDLLVVKGSHDIDSSDPGPWRFWPPKLNALQWLWVCGPHRVFAAVAREMLKGFLWRS